MPQDAFTLRLIAKELDGQLRGGRVNKINQPGKEEVSLLIYTGKRTVKLLLSANASVCGVYFTDEGRENPLSAPGFCMLLRKYLQSAELLSVTTPGFERVLLFRFRCVSDFSEKERVLLAEIMGKYSNLLLLEDGVILGALKTNVDETCKRLIFPGAVYSPPARQDKIDPSDKAALTRLFAENPDRGADFLFRRVAGLAPCTAEQIVASFRGGDFAAHVHDFIFSDEISPRVAERDGVVTDFFARADAGIPFDTISAAQCYFYGKKAEKRAFDAQRRRAETLLKNAAKKAEKRLAGILEKKLSCADMEQNRIKGELLTANLYALSRGMRSCELPNYYDENGKTLSVLLDPQKSPAENAQAYFKKYRKEKRTLEALAPQEAETAAELEYLRSLLAALYAAESADDLAAVDAELAQAGLLSEPKERTKKERPETFRTFEREGFRICAGRNNLQNDRLVRQSAPDDIWLHAQKYHSCHVVIKTGGKPVPDSVLQFCANLCAKYSDGGGDKIPVDYCAVKFVKKPPKSKAGFVTYSDFKTLLGDPSALA